MWMVSCGDNDDLKMPDSLNCTKLWPTNSMQPVAACCKNPTTTTITQPYSSCSYSPPTLPGLHRHAKPAEQSMKGSNDEQPSAVNSRWSPTPEQLLALEEMYRCGTRTPTADQIQQIAAQLRRYGKIEGKNIFYWFQNHKARERQKRRRQQNREAQSLDKKDSGLRRTNPELEQSQLINNLPPFSSCNKHSEGLDSLHGAAEEQQQHGWWQFGERELQEKHSPQREGHATRQTMNWSSMASTPTAKVINFQRPTTLLKTKGENNIHVCLEDELREIQTLQLFPLRSDDCKGVNGNKKDKRVPIRAINTNFSPNKFFEFLPLKN